MLLAVDVGNTQTVFGLFEGETMRANWRLSSQPGRTEDEWALAVASLLELRAVPREEITASILCSVVPPLTPILVETLHSLFGSEPLQVGPGTKTGIKILYENPQEVGADRIVNSVAAVALVGAPAIVVDLGTATTFDAISPRSEYLGGIIVPGLQISADALFARAARLPRVSVLKPPRLIGRNTVHSIQSGLYHGYASMISGVLASMRTEMEGEPKVIATGGLCTVLAPDLHGTDLVDPHLTLQGLRIIHLKNRAT